MNASDPVAPFPAPVEEAVAPRAPRPAGPPPILAKRPALAAFFALFPGMGHVYNGLYVRGLAFFLVIFSLMGIVVRGHGLMGLAMAFCWLFNVLDSYRQAALINYGYAQDLGLLDLPQRPLAGQAGIVGGVLLIGLGTFALLDRFFAIDIERLFDFWPAVLILAGAWLVFATIRERRRQADQG